MSGEETRRSVIEDFEFLRVLGKGSWGTVWLVRRRVCGGEFAVKTVQLHNRSRKDQMDAVKEAQLLARLSSPHITRYYDSFLHDNVLHIVMEYAPGGSLHAALSTLRRPMAEDVIWRVLLHTTLALHHMHSRRMLHRDVKSLNIFLSGPLEQPAAGARPLQFKLGDVGVSKVLEEGKNHASTIIGTPFYLSPEICQEKSYDSKVDIWALGVVLYECATLRHPFDAQSQPALLMKILRGRYDPVVGLSNDLTAIINRCLSQAAGRRPSTERLLSLPAVRAKAAELGIELPPVVVAVSPVALPAAAGMAIAGQSGGKAAIAEARAGWRPLQPPKPRRATCPEGPAAQSPGGGSRAESAVLRNAQPAAVAAGEGWSPASARLRRHSSGGDRPRKPPLPAAAVPTRRRTVQEGKAPAAGKHIPAEKQGKQPVASVLASPLQAAAAAAAAPALAAVAQPQQPPQQMPLLPVAAVAASCQASSNSLISPETSSSSSSAFRPSPRRTSHFSVQQHLEQLSGAAKQWLAQQGGGSDGSRVGSALEVQRSAKSDSSLLVQQQLQQHQQQHQQQRQVRFIPPTEQANSSIVAGGSDSAEGSTADVAAAERAALVQLRQRCIALLGSQKLFEELHTLAQAAVDGVAQSNSGGGVAAGPRTLTALGDLLLQRLPPSNRQHAAEALHLLLKILYYEA